MGTEGGVIFFSFFLLLFILVFHPFPWLLAPVPLDSPIGGLKKSKMTKKKYKKKKKRKKKQNSNLKNKASHPHSCFPSRRRSPEVEVGARADLGRAGGPRTPSLRTTIPAGARDRAVGAWGRLTGVRPSPQLQPRLLTFVCSFAFSLSANVSSPESLEQGAF